MTAARKPLPPYPASPGSRSAADKNRAAIRTVRGLADSLELLVQELDDSFAEGLARYDARANTRARITALAKSAQGRRS